MAESSVIQAGTSVVWERRVPGYSSATYALRYTFANQTRTFSLMASPAPTGDGFRLALTVSQTAALAVGDYGWRAFAELGAEERVEVARGRVTIAPSLFTDTPVDERSPARRALEAIQAVLEDRATRGQEAMTFNNRSLSRTPIADLLKLQEVYAARVAHEDARAAGRKVPRSIRVRFGG